jgi:hypothetical protein
VTEARASETEEHGIFAVELVARLDAERADARPGLGAGARRALRVGSTRERAAVSDMKRLTLGANADQATPRAQADGSRALRARP